MYDMVEDGRCFYEFMSLNMKPNIQALPPHIKNRSTPMTDEANLPFLFFGSGTKIRLYAGTSSILCIVSTKKKVAST
jgi:hypothetical protein